mgnify:FL=1
MTKDEIRVNGVPISIGDARFTLYRIEIDAPAASRPEAHSLFHSHSYYELHILAGGRASIRIAADGMRTIAFCGGQLVIVSPGTEHLTEYSENPLIHCTVLSLDLTETDGDGGFYRYFRKILDANANRPLSLPLALYEKILLYRQITQDTPIREYCLIQFSTHEILLGLFDFLGGFLGTEDRPEPQRNDREARIVLENLMNDTRFTLEDIAREIGYSPRQTARHIRQLCGKSLGEYRLQSQIATAKKLLSVEGRTATITEIARQTGFASVSSMRAAFCREVGCTPSEYALAHTAATEDSGSEGTDA